MKFNFRTLTHSPERLNVQSAKLGDPADVTSETYVKFTDNDVGKPVKKGTQGNYLLCSKGDAIEGFIDNIDAGGRIDEMTMGGVAFCNRGARMKVTVDTGVAKIAVLDYVVAGTNLGASLANTGGLGIVEKSSAATRWRIVSLEGDIAETAQDACEMIANPNYDDQEPIDPVTNPEFIESCDFPATVVAVIELV